MDVKHVARLANLPLSADEEKTFADQMPAILNYVDQLQKIDASSVSDTVSATDEKNVTRADRVKACEPLVTGFVKTKAIFTNDE